MSSPAQQTLAEQLPATTTPAQPQSFDQVQPTPKQAQQQPVSLSPESIGEMQAEKAELDQQLAAMVKELERVRSEEGLGEDVYAQVEARLQMLRALQALDAGRPVPLQQD
ncbi:hypothetical protein N2152v2_009368 [Parachlorella kessleri]